MDEGWCMWWIGRCGGWGVVYVVDREVWWMWWIGGCSVCILVHISQGLVLAPTVILSMDH